MLALGPNWVSPSESATCHLSLPTAVGADEYPPLIDETTQPTRLVYQSVLYWMEARRGHPSPADLSSGKILSAFGSSLHTYFLCLEDPQCPSGCECAQQGAAYYITFFSCEKCLQPFPIHTHLCLARMWVVFLFIQSDEITSLEFVKHFIAKTQVNVIKMFSFLSNFLFKKCTQYGKCFVEIIITIKYK